MYISVCVFVCVCARTEQHKQLFIQNDRGARNRLNMETERSEGHGPRQRLEKQEF